MRSRLFCSSWFLMVAACASGAHQPSPGSATTGSSESTNPDVSLTMGGTGNESGVKSNSASTVDAMNGSGAVSSDRMGSDSCDRDAACSSSTSNTGATHAGSAMTDGTDTTASGAQQTSDAPTATGSPSTAWETSLAGSTNDPITQSETSTLQTSGDPDAPLTIWLAGDSTVANGNTPCPTGWGKYLGEFFDASTTVRNSAAGGRSVRTWAYNVQTQMDADGECELQRDANGEPTVQSRWQEMLDNMKTGDALLVQFGINDGSATCDRHVGLDAFKQTYGVLAAAAKERGAVPIFITPVSAIACSGSSPQGSRGEYVDATIEAGAQHGVAVLDLHARSVERYAELGFCPVAGGDVSAETTGPVGDYFCDDHTHFSASGAADIASLVVELLTLEHTSITAHLK